MLVFIYTNEEPCIGLNECPWDVYWQLKTMRWNLSYLTLRKIPAPLEGFVTTVERNESSEVVRKRKPEVPVFRGPPIPPIIPFMCVVAGCKDDTQFTLLEDLERHKADCHADTEIPMYGTRMYSRWSSWFCRT
jgi:hypothetical protein